MWVWRGLIFIVVVALIGLPILVPVGAVVTHLHRPVQWDSVDRLGSLLFNTCVLVVGTNVIAIPLGTLLATLLVRTNLPLRTVFFSLTLVCLFLPLPLQITAWQAALQHDVWLLSAFWQPRPGQPWPQGFIPAIWVHSIVAVPWVTVIVGQALRQHNAEWEEEALLSVAAWRVLWSVTLLRARPAVILASLWVTLQVFGDISVTDMFLVRTFGEEVYLLFSRGGTDSWAQTVAECTPVSLMVAGLLIFFGWRMSHQFPSFQVSQRHPFRFSLGQGRWLGVLFALIVLWVLLGLPVQSLWWKAGLAGTPLHWNWGHWWNGLVTTFVLDGGTVVTSLLLCLACGVLAAGLALGICWTAQSNTVLRFFYFGLLTFAIALPSPVVGFGSKEVILWIVRWAPGTFLAKVLYFGPSHAPILWAYLLRTVPLAVAVLWPCYQRIPREWLEAAQIEGATPWQLLRRVQIPLLLRPILVVIFAVAALALNEVGTSKIAGTPGTETFTLLLFNRMHYGVSQDVSCLALVLLFVLFAFLTEYGLRYAWRTKSAR